MKQQHVVGCTQQAVDFYEHQGEYVHHTHMHTSNSSRQRPPTKVSSTYLIMHHIEQSGQGMDCLNGCLAGPFELPGLAAGVLQGLEVGGTEGLLALLERVPSLGAVHLLHDGALAAVLVGGVLCKGVGR